MTAKVNKGGVRPVSKTGKAYQNRFREFSAKIASVGYSDGYFNKDTGGFYLIERTKYRHKKEEVEAARILADKGYKVYLKNEMGEMSKGDGVIFTFSYEQITPDKASGPHGVKKCIDHAKLKRVQVSLIYDKNGRFSQNEILKGIAEYERHASYRFEKIMVIDTIGRIHNYRYDN